MKAMPSSSTHTYTSCIIESQLWCRPKWTEKSRHHSHISLIPLTGNEEGCQACSGCGRGFGISTRGFLGRIPSSCPPGCPMEDVLSRTSTGHALRGYVENVQDIALLLPNRFANRSIVSYLLNEQTLRLCSTAQPNVSSSFLCYG